MHPYFPLRILGKKYTLYTAKYGIYDKNSHKTRNRRELLTVIKSIYKDPTVIIIFMVSQRCPVLISGTCEYVTRHVKREIKVPDRIKVENQPTLNRKIFLDYLDGHNTIRRVLKNGRGREKI